jgi:N-methylhydantoinase B
MTNKTTKVDPITVAVMNSRFESICEEMGRTLFRTSRSIVFSEARDFAVSVFDKDARLLAQKEYVPVLAGANPTSMRSINSAYKGNVNEGDVFIHNDPYSGNSHIGDVNIAKPVFYRGELMFWTMAKGHMADSGNKGVAGVDPSRTRIWQDGILIPAIKLYEKGKLNEGVKLLFLSNLKVPEIVWGDIMCELGGCTIAERHLMSLLDRYGASTMYGAIEEILTTTETDMRKRIRDIPDGIYYGENSTDHDGLNKDKPITIRVKITVYGDELTIDLSDSDKSSNGYLNVSEGVTFSMCHMIISYVLPGVVRRNEGAMAPIKIITREGTCVNPKFPTAVAKATTQGAECLGGALLAAFSKAIPNFIAAPHGKMAQIAVSGFNPRTKRRWAELDFFMTCCPSGGTEGYDGWDLGGPIFNLGSMRLPDLEIIELVKPVHILQHEQEIDTAGAGKFRSGLGHVYKVRYLADCSVGSAFTGAGMRDYSLPFGLFGGKSPKPHRVILRKANGTIEKPDVHSFIQINSGDIVECHFGAGGGFGPPFERDVERVREDVLNEVVSIEAAARDYGVVIDPVTLEVDHKATKRLRKEVKK